MAIAIQPTPVLEIAELLGDLVRIPSVNPLHAGPISGDDGERAISTWLADRTAAMGADVVLDDIIDGRNNVYATFAGESDGAITIDVHLDTVGVEHMTRDPFDGAIEDGRVYGRGSVDTKATLAIVLTVLDELAVAGRRPAPTVHLVGTVSEEMGGLIGAAGYREWLDQQGTRLERIIVAEPTMCAPVHGHKGGLGLEITVHGHAAHSSKPHLGKNAISGAARIVTALDAEQERLAATHGETAVGPGTLSVNEIAGGRARNIIPDRCELFAGRRTVPEEDPGEIFDQLSAMVRRAAAPLDVDIALANGIAHRAFYQEPDSALIGELAELSGSQPEVATYGSNALHYGTVADQIVVFGPGSIDQAHQAVEWIEIAELERAAEIYRQLLT